jgi:selenocysteine-specific elongation factor
LIIGTAGHIDHGKTSLVRALTGVDTDRLAEEKARGITIELGFAYQGELGFVDVPGHERLVRTMLAGATGIDHVLLAIAADDGPMPQTREHLAILNLLGLKRGVVALTKADLVDASRLSEVQAEVQALLAGSTLADAPVLPVSTVTGAGLDALKAHLEDAARQDDPDPAHEHAGAGFRLAVDRAFSLAGVGTVVTGTAVAGEVHVADRLMLSPKGKPVRVRGLHAHNQPAERGHRGQRLALNLTGVDKAEVQRGDWIVAEGLHAPSSCMDVELHLLAGEAKPLAHRSPLHLHLGAADVPARLNLLDRRELEPGATAWAQIELERPTSALRGDRFVVRDASATRTLGGGWVVDVFAVAQRRHKQRHLPRVAAMAQPTLAAALGAGLALHASEGLALQRLGTLWNQPLSAVEAAAKEAGAAVLSIDSVVTAFAAASLDEDLQRLVAVLTAHHRKMPDSPGLGGEGIWKALDPRRTARPKPAVFAAWLAEAQARSLMTRAGPYWRLAGHEATLLPTELKLWQRIEPWLLEGDIHPPKLSELLIRDRTLHKEHVTRLLAKLTRMGKLYAVGNEYVLLPAVMRKLADASQQLARADEHHRLEVKALREHTGISRHFSMPLVEFFDHIGFTKRDAIGRKVRREARELFGGS